MSKYNKDSGYSSGTHTMAHRTVLAPQLTVHQRNLLHQTTTVNNRVIKFYVQAIGNYNPGTDKSKLSLNLHEIYAVINSTPDNLWHLGCAVGKNALETWKFRSERENLKYFPANYVKKLSPMQENLTSKFTLKPSIHGEPLKGPTIISSSNTNTTEFSKQKVTEYLNESRNSFPNLNQLQTLKNQSTPHQPIISNLKIPNYNRPASSKLYNNVTFKSEPVISKPSFRQENYSYPESKTVKHNLDRRLRTF